MDRNNTRSANIRACILSLSARRAWIEILESKQIDPSVMVALRKESVDRNSENPMISINKVPSLSARRAWIEMRGFSGG